MTLVKCKNHPSIFEDIYQWFNYVADDEYIIQSELDGLTKKSNY
jgi:hypothetical protein